MQGQLRCTDCSQGPQNPGSTIFRKKTSFFLNFIGPVTPPWNLYPSEIMHMDSTERLLARAEFARSIKVLGWQPGAPKIRQHVFPKKNADFLKFIGPVTALWVLQPSQIMHMVCTEPLLARAVFTKSIRVFWMASRGPKTPGARFSEKKKNVLFF